MYLNTNITKTEIKKPKILLLYGSLRKGSYSYLVTKEAQLILNYLGAETKIFNPHNLPVFNKDVSSHPEAEKLRELMTWSDGQVWCSPEQHGGMTSVFKNQIDWVPLNIGGVRPTQGKTLALVQISGGSQSFNTLNQMRILGRWMRMFTIPNQSSIEKAFLKFEQNRMTRTPFYNRLVDVMEELMKFTILLSQHKEFLTDRYSERVESVECLSKRVNQEKI
ncbi:arsenical resistance protein ArsH [Paraphotobacterium marinum]|nr:arsenical resistance protein ArsH [Paraphotobacterium marinum]